MGNPKILVATVIGAKFPPDCMTSHLLLDYTPIQYLTNRNGLVVGSTNIRKKALYKRRLESITDARNWILQEAFKLQWDYILWLDSDVKVYPDTLNCLLAFTPKEKVVSAFSYYRQGTSVLTYAKNGYADWVGFNCLLVSRAVHNKVGYFTPDSRGEDVEYGERINRSGFKIFIARDVKVQHNCFEYELLDNMVDKRVMSKAVEQVKMPAHKGLFAVTFGKYSDITLTICNRAAHINDPKTRKYIDAGLIPHINITDMSYIKWATDNGFSITSKPLPEQCFRLLLCMNRR